MKLLLLIVVLACVHRPNPAPKPNGGEGGSTGQPRIGKVIA